MALINCKECGEQVSTQAASCPKCGAPVFIKKKGPNGCMMTLIILVSVIILIYVLGGINSNSLNVLHAKNETVKNVDAEAKSLPTEQVKDSSPAQPVSNWQKGSVKDEMTDKERPYAAITSLNGAAFNFPYHVEGGSKATIVIRRDIKNKVAYVMVEKGQMICSYDGCTVQTKSESGVIKNWRASEAAPGVHNAIFISDSEGFENYIKKSKKIRIGVEFYEYGIKSFDFDVSNYPGLN